MTYTFTEDATLLDVWHRVDTVCYVLSSEDVMWVWESVPRIWRKPTDDERGHHLPMLELGKRKAPRLQATVHLPVIQGG